MAGGKAKKCRGELSVNASACDSIKELPHSWTWKTRVPSPRCYSTHLSSMVHIQRRTVKVALHESFKGQTPQKDLRRTHERNLHTPVQTLHPTSSHTHFLWAYTLQRLFSRASAAGHLVSVNLSVRLQCSGTGTKATCMYERYVEIQTIQKGTKERKKIDGFPF